MVTKGKKWKESRELRGRVRMRLSRRSVGMGQRELWEIKEE